MDLPSLIPLIPIGTFWVSFSSIVAACKFAHEQKEKIIDGKLAPKYLELLRTDTRGLCIGVVFAILVFAVTLTGLAVVLWEHDRLAGSLVAIQALFAFFAAWTFGEGSVRFFRVYPSTVKLYDGQTKRTMNSRIESASS